MIIDIVSRQFNTLIFKRTKVTSEGDRNGIALGDSIDYDGIVKRPIHNKMELKSDTDSTITFVEVLRSVIDNKY